MVPTGGGVTRRRDRTRLTVRSGARAPDPGRGSESHAPGAPARRSDGGAAERPPRRIRAIGRRHVSCVAHADVSFRPPGQSAHAWGLWLVVSGLVAAPALVRDRVPVERGVLLAFALCTALVWGARPGSCRARARRGRALAAFALALGAGLASYPAWIALFLALSRAAGVSPPPSSAPGSGSAEAWIASAALAPVFEELLYRERLRLALRPRLGPVATAFATSALFAIPHLHLAPAAFAVGLALAAVAERARAIAPCIGLHAGLNLSVVACGLPPTRLALAPLGGAAIGGALLLTAVRISRRAQREKRSAEAR